MSASSSTTSTWRARPGASATWSTKGSVNGAGVRSSDMLYMRAFYTVPVSLARDHCHASSSTARVTNDPAGLVSSPHPCGAPFVERGHEDTHRMLGRRAGYIRLLDERRWA